jgi:LemA protein
MATASDTPFLEAVDLEGRLISATNFILDYWWLWLALALAWHLLSRLRAHHEMLGKMDERCEAAFADVDALLVERRGLIDNLVTTVKGFAVQEHTVLKDVIDARARAMSTMGSARLEAETQIGQSLNSLFAITENYPDLASSTHFRELRSEMTRMEDRITAARRFYNLSVEELNGTRRAFPGNVIALFATFGSHEKFSAGERRAELAEAAKISL